MSAPVKLVVLTVMETIETAVAVYAAKRGWYYIAALVGMHAVRHCPIAALLLAMHRLVWFSEKA